MDKGSIWLVAYGNLSYRFVRPEFGWFPDWDSAHQVAMAQWDVEYDRYLADAHARLAAAVTRRDQFRAAHDAVVAVGMVPSFRVPDLPAEPLPRQDWTKDRLNDRRDPLSFHQMPVRPPRYDMDLPTGRVWLSIQVQSDGRAWLAGNCLWSTSKADAAADCDILNGVDRAQYDSIVNYSQARNTEAQQRFDALTAEAAVVAAAGLPVPFTVPDKPDLHEVPPAYEQWREARLRRQPARYEPTPLDPAGQVAGSTPAATLPVAL